MSSVADQVLELISDSNIVPVEYPVTSRNQNLWDSGMSSLGWLRLMTLLETAFGIEFEEEELTPETFRSASSIAQAISRKMP